jgi:hypothetical protein
MVKIKRRDLFTQKVKPCTRRRGRDITADHASWGMRRYRGEKAATGPVCSPAPPVFVARDAPLEWRAVARSSFVLSVYKLKLKEKNRQNVQEKR